MRALGSSGGGGSGGGTCDVLRVSDSGGRPETRADAGGMGGGDGARGGCVRAGAFGPDGFLVASCATGKALPGGTATTSRAAGAGPECRPGVPPATTAEGSDPLPGTG